MAKIPTIAITTMSSTSVKPERRRAGVPEDVAALVHALGDRSTEVTLVNTGRVARTVVVQGGSYAEHRIDAVTVDKVNSYLKTNKPGPFTIVIVGPKELKVP